MLILRTTTIGINWLCEVYVPTYLPVRTYLLRLVVQEAGCKEARQTDRQAITFVGSGADAAAAAAAGTTDPGNS